MERAGLILSDLIKKLVLEDDEKEKGSNASGAHEGNGDAGQEQGSR